MRRCHANKKSKLEIIEVLAEISKWKKSCISCTLVVLSDTQKKAFLKQNVAMLDGLHFYLHDMNVVVWLDF